MICQYCAKEAKARRMCQAHYGVWRRGGDPATTGPSFTAQELAEEIMWLLDGGESLWQVATAVHSTPSLIRNRLDQARMEKRIDDTPELRQAINQFRQLAREEAT